MQSFPLLSLLAGERPFNRRRAFVYISRIRNIDETERRACSDMPLLAQLTDQHLLIRSQSGAKVVSMRCLVFSRKCHPSGISPIFTPRYRVAKNGQMVAWVNAMTTILAVIRR